MKRLRLLLLLLALPLRERRQQGLGQLLLVHLLLLLLWVTLLQLLLPAWQHPTLLLPAYQACVSGCRGAWHASAVSASASSSSVATKHYAL